VLEVLAALEAQLRRRYPSAAIVRTESPPLRDLSAEERAEQRDRIIASGAEIVWVGLGTTKQDWEAARLATDTRLVFAAVGAAVLLRCGAGCDQRGRASTRVRQPA
jgi:N-acetylglucosaminyldiphosphoundecaprenol N-acetyl-beta-D-mannosaminyltransferase